MASLKKHGLFALIILGSTISLSADEQGRRIMEKNYALKKAVTVSNKSIMVIFRAGTREFREFNVFTKRYGGQLRSRLIFTKPVKIDLISWSEARKENRQWLNLSGKFQEIASSDKRSEFMGSHFYFEDLSEQYLDDFEYIYLGEKNIGKIPCYRIEARKINGSNVYVKTILYVRKSDYFVIQADLFEKRGHTKTLSLDQIEVIDGITLARKITMSRTGSADKSIVYLKYIEYDLPVSDAIFTP